MPKHLSHALVFLVKCVANQLSHGFAKFDTDGISAFQIMPIFWQSVRYLERINLKVIEVAADGGSQKRFFTMHTHLVGDSDTKIL